MTTAIKHDEGWYEIAGYDSYHGSDNPRYLRALILTGSQETRIRARAVLNHVERNTPWIMRRFRDWRWSR